MGEDGPTRGRASSGLLFVPHLLCSSTQEASRSLPSGDAVLHPDCCRLTPFRAAQMLARGAWVTLVRNPLALSCETGQIAGLRQVHHCCLTRQSLAARWSGGTSSWHPYSIPLLPITPSRSAHPRRPSAPRPPLSCGPPSRFASSTSIRHCSAVLGRAGESSTQSVFVVRAPRRCGCPRQAVRKAATYSLTSASLLG